MAPSGDGYRQLFERNTAVQLVADPVTGAILDANQAATDFYGLSHDALTRRHLADLSPDPNELAPEQLEVASLVGAQLTAVPQRHASGEHRLVDIYAGPVTLSNRLVVHLIVHDVTERARNEERERAMHAERVAGRITERAAQEWQGSFDAIDLPMLVVDDTGRLTRANRAATTWTTDTPPSLTGTLIESLAESPVWRIAAERVRIARERGASSPSRVSDAAHGGRTWEIWATRFVPSEGSAPHYIVVARDLTALLALQEELQRQETMARMGELVAGVAHEVRNALFALSSAVDAMQARAGNSPDLARYSPVLTSQVQRLSDLTRDLLEYGKPMSLSVVPCALDDLFRGTVAAASSAAESQGVATMVRVAPDVGTVVADRSRILQVLQNLLLNAIQHSPRGATVEISATRHVEDGRPRCRFDVADRGPGFEADALRHAFEPFFTRRAGGTGLGLAIAHRIVHDHGGMIWATNRPGGGAVVSFLLEIA